MAITIGTQYYVPVTVDNAYIDATLSYFPYQIDLSSKLASDSIFKGYISTAANISVYDPTSDTDRPRIVSLDLATNKLFISFDAPTTTAADKTFYICVGGAISKTNAAETFSNSSYAHRWGMNEFSGTTVYNSVGAYNGTLTTATLVTSGYFGNGVNIPGAGKVDLANEIMGSGNITVEAIYMFRSAGTGAARLWDNGKMVSFILGGAWYAQIDGATSMIPSSLSYNTPYHMCMTRTSAGVCNFFLNGSHVGSTDYAGGTPANGSYNLYLASVNGSSPINGIIDEYAVTSDIKSATFISTRYKQFFQAGFWTVGTGVSSVPEGGIVPSGQLPKVYAPYNPYIASKGIYQNKYNLRMKNLRGYLGI